MRIVSLLVLTCLSLSACSSMSRTDRTVMGGIAGAGVGAAVSDTVRGAGIGAVAGAAIGAATY